MSSPAFTLAGPVDSATLPLAQNGHQERSNRPVLSVWSITEQAPAACTGVGGMGQEANAQGKALGYADVAHDSWIVETTVGVHTS